MSEPAVAAAREEPSFVADRASAPPPPMLSGSFLLGHVPDFRRNPYALFIRGYRTHGPIFRLRVPGRSFVAFAGAEGLRFLAKNERDLFESSSIFGDFVRLFGGERALVNVDGDVHAELRKRFRPTMARTTFEQAIPRVVEVTRARLAALDGQEVPLERFARDLVFHQLSTVMNVGGVDPDEFYEDLIRVMHYALETTVAKRWPRILLRDPRFVRALRHVVALGHTLVRRVGADDPPDGLFPVLRRAVADGLLSERDVPMLAITPYFAGIDTVAASMSFLLAEVYRDRALRETLRAEAEDATSASGGEPLGRKWLDRLVRTEAAKNEAMRCHPVILTMIRRAKRSFEFNGYSVKAGEDAMFAVGSQHIMEEYFPEPHRFDAERFLRGDDAVPFAFSPYGAGPHSCLGAALADAQLVTTLAALLEHGELELTNARAPIETGYSPYALPVGEKVRVRLRTTRGPSGNRTAASTPSV